ncbi:putative ATPase [Rhodoferax ferrireducens]|uniref:ATPase n=1 Tax=Rhodoferax ferrireducens TaxID=192843 RepID=A0ABU2C796_9BURK|nr:AAA family ATPase [Rhodoferax ferrireducens]MDR7377198.1 putative ATPase [Rhodoferax ferrireducens]
MILSSVLISGLWGKPPLKLSFNDSVNFMVGQNGTGKTTIINLIAAGLAADFERLDRIDFMTMELVLKPLKKGKNTKISITKKQKSDLPYYDINYTIRHGSDGKPVTYDLDRLAEERHYRSVPPRHLRELLMRNGGFADLNKTLSELVQVTLLSVNRFVIDAKTEPRPTTERNISNPVDQKLDTIINQLVRLFSKLDRESADAAANFQRDSFVSLLSIETTSLFKSAVQKLEVAKETDSLTRALTEIGVDQKKTSSVITTLFKNFDIARRKIQNGDGMLLQEFMVLAGTLRANSLVQKYDALQVQRRKIFALRDSFLEEVNALLGPRKIVVINERNEIEARSPEGRVIRPMDLSSGEKQLLIILGEALLQDQQSVIFIADEPELSLHVSWQEKLVPAITRINTNAQIIFATHSPDIVGSYADCVSVMEDIW